MAFFVEVLVGGLLAGVMYSLVALGFVLIYKASGVFNFAQGAMVFFAATTYAGLVGLGWSGWLAFAASLGVMVVFAIATERFVLRPLVNQPQISLFMATIGLTFVLEGVAQAVWGAEVRGLELGIPDSPLEVKGILISKFDLVAAATAGGLVVVLALFFQKTRVGRALRAVADDHQAALSVGISLNHIWVIVWFTAGIVALATGIFWGARSDVSFALQ
ncbi:MAG TPA: branched-chain amino acid ABC transporter permease, partial [Myxococcaceae bacterium]